MDVTLVPAQTTAPRPLVHVLANLASLGVLAAGAPPFVFLVGTSLDGRRSSVLASFAIEALVVTMLLVPAIVRWCGAVARSRSR